MERCVWLVTNLIRKSISQQNLRKRDLVLTISHEDLVQETDRIVEEIETFIGQKRTSASSIQLSKQNCPRKIDANIEKLFLRDIRSLTRQSLVTDLESLVEDFKDNVYGFCKK
jgi:delta-aminolevulinic acid dehydratase/porphobilinogen synthase